MASSATAWATSWTFLCLSLPFWLVHSNWLDLCRVTFDAVSWVGNSIPLMDCHWYNIELAERRKQLIDMWWPFYYRGGVFFFFCELCIHRAPVLIDPLIEAFSVCRSIEETAFFFLRLIAFTFAAFYIISIHFKSTSLGCCVFKFSSTWCALFSLFCCTKDIHSKLITFFGRFFLIYQVPKNAPTWNIALN